MKTIQVVIINNSNSDYKNSINSNSENNYLLLPILISLFHNLNLVIFHHLLMNSNQLVEKLFETLDYLDKILGQSKYLVGSKFTEADLRLIPTLLRFDVVYVTHFKCNIRRFIDYENLTCFNFYSLSCFFNN